MQLQDGSVSKVIILRDFLAASLAGVIAEKSRVVREQKIIPQLDMTDSGRVLKLEKFSHYVARQMGFVDASKVPELCRLAHDYLTKHKECEENIFEYIANEKDPDYLSAKLIGEFERCILSYFAFHWNQAPYMISQVLSVESPQKMELKKFLLEATRKQRFERVTKNLKVARAFCTLVEEMKAIWAEVKVKVKEHFLSFLGE